MALVGYFSINKNTLSDDFNKCNKNKINCIAFFHISARNDTSYAFFDPDLENIIME
uniref:Uncharacterized protein n=1 Tax=Meloidogyne hapla TaxID=6305 RepID=A0A1I8B2L8_MELHA